MIDPITRPGLLTSKNFDHKGPLVQPPPPSDMGGFDSRHHDERKEEERRRGTHQSRVDTYEPSVALSSIDRVAIGKFQETLEPATVRIVRSQAAVNELIQLRASGESREVAEIIWEEGPVFKFRDE